jgi:hypothetical protein
MVQMGCVIPERANEPYFIISANWYVAWQKYTGCFKTEHDDSDDDMVISKDQLVLGEHPGPMNSRKDLASLF